MGKVLINRAHLADATAIFACSIPFTHRGNLTYRDGTTGVKWVRAFYKRHKKQLKYVVLDPQEEKMFATVNAETLSTHFYVLERLVEKYKTGVSEGCDTSRKVRQPRFMPRDVPDTDIKKVVISKTDRVIVMPCVSTNVFVFKGTKLSYREVRMHGQNRVETLSSSLPRDAVVAMRKECGSDDGEVFCQWVLQFTEHIKDLTTGRRHVLLI